MSIIVSTWGGSSANCYVTLAEAQSFMQSGALIDTTDWDNFGDVKQERALILGTRAIDAKNWAGERWFYQQMLEFPRTAPGVDIGLGAISRDGPSDAFINLTLTDEYLRKMKIRVQQATVLQAAWYARNGEENDHREQQFHGIRSVGRSVRSSESFGYGEPAMAICPEAWDLLRYYKGSIRLLRGDAGFIRRT